MRLTLAELQALPEGTRLYTDGKQRSDWYWRRGPKTWLLTYPAHPNKFEGRRADADFLPVTINLILEPCTLDEAEEFIRSA